MAFPFVAVALFAASSALNAYLTSKARKRARRARREAAQRQVEIQRDQRRHPPADPVGPLDGPLHGGQGRRWQGLRRAGVGPAAGVTPHRRHDPAQGERQAPAGALLAGRDVRGRGGDGPRRVGVQPVRGQRGEGRRKRPGAQELPCGVELRQQGGGHRLRNGGLEVRRRLQVQPFRRGVLRELSEAVQQGRADPVRKVQDHGPLHGG